MAGEPQLRQEPDEEEANEEAESEDEEEISDAWQLAKAIVLRGGQGAIVKLSGRGRKAWLPWDKIRSCPGRSEEELRKALQQPIKVRVDGSQRHMGLPYATMWNHADDGDLDGALRREEYRLANKDVLDRERKIARLRTSCDPSAWLDGTVSSVKEFGVFLDTIHDLRVLVPLGYIPQELLLDNGAPNLDVGNTVQFRIYGYRGKDHRGKDRFSCSMLPPPSKEEAANASKGKGKSKQKGAGKGRKGTYQDRRGVASETSGYSVWVPDRQLESESTLARQEKFEINALPPEYLAEQYGKTDRRAAFARKGFAVVDYATSLQLSQAIKPKTEAKLESAATLKPTPVWLTLDNQRRQVGKIQTTASMTTSEKERLAVDLALEAANDAIQDGTNVRKVDVLDDKVLIRLATDGGLQF